MPRRLPDFNEPHMQALLSHLKNPSPLRTLTRVHGLWVLKKVTGTGLNNILVGQPMFKMADIHTYTFAEVKFAKAHLAVLGYA